MTEIEMYKNYLKKLAEEDEDWLDYIDRVTGVYEDGDN